MSGFSCLVFSYHFSNLLCTNTKAKIPQESDEGLSSVSSLKGNFLENEQYPLYFPRQNASGNTKYNLVTDPYS
jgi:hypothetical protein